MKERAVARVRTHLDLDVYSRSVDGAKQIFELSKRFPREECYSLTDQMRRSSRSVSANICEAWRKRRYEDALISKLSDAETEAAETQVWIEFAARCKFWDRKDASVLYRTYDGIINTLIGMINHPETWTITSKP